MRSRRTRYLSAVRTIGAIAAAILVLVPASSLAAEDTTDGLTGVDWQLTSIAIDGSLEAVPEGVAATLRIEDGEASGSTGCNTFGGTVTVEGAALTFGTLSSTLRLCEDPLGAVEGPYLEALPLVAAWSIGQDGSLSLTDGEGQVVLQFTAAAPGEAGPGMIEGVTWVLREQAADGTLGPLPPDVLVTMRLDAGAAGGDGGCNSWFASYTIDGDVISFSDIGSTLIACDEPANTVERTFFANLEAATSFTTDATSLSLASADGTTILVFDQAEAGTIVGSWVATAIAIGSGVVSSETTSAVTAEFTADGQLSGSDGCNSYDGTYTVDGQSIAIGPLASTRMACADEELDAQAMAYAEALAAAAMWAVDPSGTLTLTSAEGSVLITYAPAGA
jgi:heat shock protein HslJ